MSVFRLMRDRRHSGRRRRRARTTVLCLFVLAISGAAAGTARGQVPPTGYQIRTTSGSIVRTTNATTGVPTPVDADAALGPDLIVEAIPPLHVTVAALTTFPVRVEIIFPFANGFAMFGYDARSSVAPALWDVTGGVTSDLAGITVDMRSVLPGRTITIIGELYRLVGGRKVDPMLANVSFDPVPTTLHIEAVRRPDRTIVDVNPSVPTNVDARVDGSVGSTRGFLRGLIQPLPTYLRIEMIQQAAPKGPLVTFRSGGNIANVEATGQLVIGGRTLDVFARLTNISARSINVEQDGAQHAVVRFPLRGSIGSIQIGLAQGGPIDRTEPAQVGASFVRAIDRGAYKSIFGRFNGLGYAGAELAEPDFRVFEISWGEPIVVGIQQRVAAPFYVDGEASGVLFTGHIKDIPSKAKITYHAAKRFIFQGTSPIREVSLTALGLTGPLVPSVPARLAKVVVQGIPNGLDVLLNVTRTNAKNATVEFDAQGKSIDVIDVALSNTIVLKTLPAGVQGALYIDTPSQWAVNGRIFGLKRASLQMVDGCNILAGCFEHKILKASTAGGSPFRVEVTTQGSDGPQTITGTIRNLPSEIIEAALRFTKTSATASPHTVRFSWWANQPAAEVIVTTSSPQRNLWVRPLPSRFNLCFHKGGKACAPGARVANKASFSFTTGDPVSGVGERTNVNFTQCDSGPCFGDDGRWIKLDNLSIDRLALGMNWDGGEDDIIELYLDTAGRDLSGNFWFENPDVGVDFRIPKPAVGRALWATNRIVFIDASCCEPTEGAFPGGTLYCPPSTQFKIYAIDLVEFDIRDIICSNL
jgi:hypothetical protein